MSSHSLRHENQEPSTHAAESQPCNGLGQAVRQSAAALPDEVWDVFELDEDTIEPDPEEGDFWGELDDEDLT